MPRKKRRKATSTRSVPRVLRGPAARPEAAAPVPSRSVVRWRLPRRFLRGFAVSLAIAAVLEGVLHELRKYHPRVQEIEDSALDWTVGVSRGAAPSRPGPVAYTFLDIDERTYREWGEPSQIPRDKLARLIERTVVACPRLLIVDVDLTQAGSQGDSAGGSEGDAALVRALGAPAPCRPPILFPVTLRGPAVRLADQEQDGLREVRPSFLKAALGEAPNVAWASPLFERASDWQIRRWRLWERVCPRGAARPPEAVPSVQLLAAGALLKPALLSALDGEVRAVIGPTLAPCASPAERGSHGEAAQKKLLFGHLALSVPPSRLNQRIVYRYPAPGELRPGEVYPRDPRTGVQLLSVVPAAPLAREDGPADPAAFKDRVVVIGGSYEEGRDVYRTPLGPMPGALILINSIDSLLEHGEIEEPGKVWRYGLVVLSVLTLSAVFAAFHPLKSLLLSLALVLLVLLPASVLLFRNGFWLDFAIPVVAVFLHKLAADVEGLYHARHQEAHG